jgi:hypothetical protein
MMKNIKTKYIQKLPSQYEIGDQYESPEECGCTYLIIAHVPEIEWIRAYISMPNRKCSQHTKCYCERTPCRCDDPFLLTPLEQEKYNLIIYKGQPDINVEYSIKKVDSRLESFMKRMLNKFDT